MKKLLLPLVVVLVVVMATLLGVGTFAMAQTATLSQQILTARYVDMGDIYAVAAHGDTACVLRALEGKAYLSVYGSTNVDVPLSQDASQLGGIHLAMYDHYVLLSMGAYITVYDIQTGKWRDTKIGTTLKQSSWAGDTYTPLTTFAVDASNGMVYACYELTVAWWAFDQVVWWANAPDEATSPETFMPEAAPLSLSKDTQNYTDLVVYQGQCHFYHSAGNGFCVDTNSELRTVTDVYTGSAIDDYAYAEQSLFLRGGEVQGTAGTLIEHGDTATAADAYLQQASAICASLGQEGWRLWVADNGQHALKMYTAAGQYLGMYGTEGNASGRMRAPTQIAKDQLTAIYDAGNCRVVVMMGEEYLPPIENVDTNCIATSGNVVYVGDGKGVMAYDYTTPTEPTSAFYIVPDTVVSVCCDGAALYALTEQGANQSLYLIRAQDQVSPTLPCTNGVRVKTGKHAGIVYVETDAAITEYKDMKPVGVSLDIGELQVRDFAMDYCGNLYVLLDDGTLQVYWRTVSGYNLEAAYATALTSLTIGDEGEVLALYHSALVSLDLEVKTKQNSLYGAPAWDEVLRAVVVQETVWGYNGPNNYESIVNVPQDTVALLLAEHSYQDTEFYYVEFEVKAVGVRYERVYVPKSAARVLESRSTDKLHVKFNGVDAATGVYPYPSDSAEPLAMVVREDAVFAVARILGVDGEDVLWPWYQIDYNGTVAFVAMRNYAPYEVIYPEVPRYEARCVANKLGQKVDVYAQPDEESEVVASLVDGTKIEMVSPYDPDSQFTCIRLDGEEVYVLTANVTTRAMTNGQTFALIMGIVVIVAALVTVVLYVLVRKRR